jgi:hypothetical protein
MHDCGPFIVEYSIDEMTLSILQRAATGQGRWRRLLQAKAAASKGLAESRELSPSTLRVWTSLPTLRPIYHLVPGGRFLVTGEVWLTPDMPPGQRRPIVSLDLWDLGCPFVRTNAPPLPLNSWTFGCGIGSEGVCCNGSDLFITGDTSFRLVVSFSSVPAQESRYVPMIAIHPNSPVDGRSSGRSLPRSHLATKGQPSPGTHSSIAPPRSRKRQYGAISCFSSSTARMSSCGTSCNLEAFDTAQCPKCLLQTRFVLTQ